MTELFEAPELFEALNVELFLIALDEITVVRDLDKLSSLAAPELT